VATADRPSPARPALRRDAQRNRDAIVAAARQLFCDHGLEPPLEQIARRAGVGITTLYRRFPSRTPPMANWLLAGGAGSRVWSRRCALPLLEDALCCCPQRVGVTEIPV
jgi:AcrR family transcriptional regulator